MKKEKFDLTFALYLIFVEKTSGDLRIKLIQNIIQETGLTFEEFAEVSCQDQSIGQLFYRILGLMHRKKIDSSHIK